LSDSKNFSEVDSEKMNQFTQLLSNIVMVVIRANFIKLRNLHFQVLNLYLPKPVILKLPQWLE